MNIYLWAFWEHLSLHFSGNTQVYNCWVIWFSVINMFIKYMFSFIRNYHILFQRGLYNFTSSPAMYEWSCFSTCPPAFYFRHSCRCVVMHGGIAIYISLMANDVSNIFSCAFWAIYISFLVKYLSFAHFLIDFFAFF